MEKHENKLIKQ